MGVLAACLAAAVAVLALVAGAIGEQRPRRRCRGLRAGGARALDGPWIVRGDRAGRGDALGWRAGRLRRAHGDGALLAQRRATCAAWPASARSRARSPGTARRSSCRARASTRSASSRSTTAPTVWVDGRLRRAPHRHLPALRGPRAPDRRRATRLVVRADWRDPAAMKADAWHRTWFNFGGINRAGDDPRRSAASELDAPSIVTRLQPAPTRWSTSAVARHATARGAADDRACAGRWRGAPRCASPPVQLGRGARATVRARRAHRAPGPVGARPPDARRRCASRSPARAVFTATRRPARAALDGRAAAAQRPAAEAARRLAAGGRAGPRRRAAPTPTWTRSSRG